MKVIKIEWRFKGPDIEWRMLDLDKRKSRAVKRQKWKTSAHGVGIAKHIPMIMGDILMAHIRYAVNCREISYKKKQKK